ncbi:hypothetical protein [Ancylobacter sp. G4_0304]|uniref:hypothetical protein n=1 Tax=Ancylobacter sp. G4_0304 TaxID=3114289 RepID=UPI0039C62C7E
MRTTARASATGTPFVFASRSTIFASCSRELGASISWDFRLFELALAQLAPRATVEAMMSEAQKTLRDAIIPVKPFQVDFAAP